MTMRVEEDAEGVTFGVYVTPRAGRSEIVGEREGALWVRLAAPPVDGKANAALVALLAERLAIPRARVTIVAGDTGRRKQVRVTGMQAGAVLRRVARS